MSGLCSCSLSCNQRFGQAPLESIGYKVKPRAIVFFLGSLVRSHPVGSLMAIFNLFISQSSSGRSSGSCLVFRNLFVFKQSCK